MRIRTSAGRLCTVSCSASQRRVDCRHAVSVQRRIEELRQGCCNMVCFVLRFRALCLPVLCGLLETHFGNRDVVILTLMARR